MTTAAEALSLVFVFTGLKSAECLQMWVEPAARRQRSSPEPGTSPVCPPCGGPELRGPGAPLAARPGSSARGICPASYDARPDNLIGLIICSSSYKARPDNLIGRIGL